MIVALIIVQALIALAMIGFILLQKSEGGGLVSQQGSQSMGRFMTRRSQADFLTRATSILAGVFMALCLLIAILSDRNASNTSLLDQIEQDTVETVAERVDQIEKEDKKSAEPSAPSRV
ncbi:MAG: preprotein translocase subunit SecG [Rickettsiales bacterium]|nr:preprotein translocase subunit SecG [Rickettsiales bacterium]|tara:strand:+ start:31114 stop:31470 length:357 start_codon:yes stop_codon:yes gene_type:complete